MPQINLLSVGNKKKSATPRLNVASFIDFSQIGHPLLVRSLACLGITFFFWAVFSYSMSKGEKILSDLEEKVKVLGTNPKEIEKLTNERAALERKVELIDYLSSRKFFWFEKFELIANLIPSGVWLTEISSQQGKASVEKIISGQGVAAGHAGKTILIIKGTAVADRIQNAVGLIGEFIKNLQGNWKFSKNFEEIKLNNATKESINGLDVMKFDFICESK